MSSGVTMPNPDEKDIVDETAELVEAMERAELAHRLLEMAARRSTETSFGWAHPDCEVLEEAARVLRGDPEKANDAQHVADVAEALRTVRRETLEEAAKVAEHEAEFRGDGDGEIWIAAKIAQAIRALGKE